MRDTFFDDRELPGIENLKALSASLEHEEEVQRHIEEGHLPPQEKAMYILHAHNEGEKRDKKRKEKNEGNWTGNPYFFFSSFFM